jgi:hypothetical protein
MFRNGNRVLLAVLLSGAMALPAVAHHEGKTKKPDNESATTDRTVKRQPLDHIPLYAGDKQVVINCVILEGPGRTLAMDLGVGSVIPEEIRFGLGQELPVIGGLFNQDAGFLPGEFGPENHVGTAAVAGNVLAVSLRPDGAITGGGLTLDQLCGPAAGTQPRPQVPVSEAMAPFKLDVDTVVAANGNLVFKLKVSAAAVDHGILESASSTPPAAAGAGSTTIVETGGSGTTIPGLSEIPVLGTLFKTAGTAHVRDGKLMILITPTVLSDGDM